ncbi:hypothetical protein HY419_01260 [candidate division WWE3 bacterium]|nr:hypothetical protein [candidate division WWE3 bacterium]
MNPIQNKKILILAGIVILVGLLTVFFIKTGALKLSFYATKTTPSKPEQETALAPRNDTPFTKMPTEEVKLASRPSNFKNASEDVEFSINLPVGWATAEDGRVDFVAGSISGEKLENGKTFYANLNAVIGKHPTGFATFADYQSKWKDGTLKQYPSMDFLTDYSTRIDDMDVYVYEITNSDAEGMTLRQIQYAFYVNEDYALIVTGTAPLNSWISYEDKIKMSVESIKLISD